MEVSVFIENIQKAFGEKVQLPFAFWYSDKQINDDLKKINGCFFKEFEKLIGGEPISLSADRIGCMGGKFYTGFSTMNEKMPMFVSSKEKYNSSLLHWEIAFPVLFVTISCKFMIYSFPCACWRKLIVLSAAFSAAVVFVFFRKTDVL